MALLSLVPVACGGRPEGNLGGGGSDLPTPNVSCNNSNDHYGGAVFYEDRPYSRVGFGNARWRPVRFAKVTVFDSSTPPVALGSAITDAGGVYCVSSTRVATDVHVQVQSVATPPGVGTISVTPLSKVGSTPYLMSGAPVAAKGGEFTVLPVLAIHVDDKVTLGPGQDVRVGGAFNILDVATFGHQTIHDAWGGTLGDVVVEWRADVATGTHYHPGESRLHISGEGAGDSDEFDDDTILHEFGHFVADRLGRDSSWGGQHFINGYTQDARLAWSEGWATFASAMIRDINPAATSNLEGATWMINAFTLTQGSQSALQWAYEIATPEAVIADRNKPDNEPTLVSAAQFHTRVKTITSEASVSAALWDIYEGVSGVPGIGKDGMHTLLVASRTLPPETIMTFGRFWQLLEPTLTQAQRDALRAQMISDRLMGLEDDLFGADDSLLELQATLAASGASQHRFSAPRGLAATYPIGEEQFTLYPEGDVDLYWLDVPAMATTAGEHYVITTTDLSDGVDTYLELLDATGATALAANDNWQNLIVDYSKATDKGTVWYHEEFRDYNGACPVLTFVATTVCPPNSANYPTQTYDLRTKEYLASQLDLRLTPGSSYLIRVTRSTTAPPSAGPHGAYRLKVDHQNY